MHSGLGAATNDGLNLSMLRQALHRVVQPSFERGDASENGGRAAAGGLGGERLRRHANSHPRGTGLLARRCDARTMEVCLQADYKSSLVLTPALIKVFQLTT